MICTVCGKSHSKEHPLTVAHNNEWLCPGCLKELDNPVYVGESGIVFPMGDLRKSITVTGNSIKIGNIELPIESFEMR
jgi:hypothetical protein